MEVFVIPLGLDRYELYCEAPAEAPSPDAPTGGIVGRLRHAFAVMLYQADARQRGGEFVSLHDPSWLARLRQHILGWVAERVADQRLLWNLRGESSSVAVYPQDLTYEQAVTVIRHTLRRDFERHRIWLVVDGALLAVSGVLALLPGPNLLAYFFAFRVMGHWLSLRGASQGLHRVTWTGRPCGPLSELRAVAALDAATRAQRVRDIAARLQLPHLSAFFERVAVRREATGHL